MRNNRLDETRMSLYRGARLIAGTQINQLVLVSPRRCFTVKFSRQITIMFVCHVLLSHISFRRVQDDFFGEKKEKNCSHKMFANVAANVLPIRWRFFRSWNCYDFSQRLSPVTLLASREGLTIYTGSELATVAQSTKGKETNVSENHDTCSSLNVNWRSS